MHMDKILQFSNQNIPHTPAEREKIINNAAKAYEKFLDALKFNWREDPNAANTPKRVAKAYVNDLIAGCYSEAPAITSFPSDYSGMLFEGNIPLVSMCAHHHQNIIGVVHIAYIPDGRVVGLSKLNRIVEFYGRRPTIQEDLTTQIHDAVNTVCENNKGVAIVVSAAHQCVSCRGIKHQGCMTKTSKLSGDFMSDSSTRAEFYNFIADLK